jgi:hypothetical protein
MDQSLRLEDKFIDLGAVTLHYVEGPPLRVLNGLCPADRGGSPVASSASSVGDCCHPAFSDLHLNLTISRLQPTQYYASGSCFLHVALSPNRPGSNAAASASHSVIS